MKKPQLVSGGTLNRLLVAAEEAWKNRDFKGNIDLLERANRLAPANQMILLQLGRMHGLMWNYDAAEAAFERALRFAPNKADFLIKAGIQSRDLRNPALAQKYFTQATQQPNAPAEAFAHLAELYERLRRIPEAKAAVEEALKRNGRCTLAQLAKARLMRIEGDVDAAEHILRELLNYAAGEVRIRAFYELGTVLDKAGRYDDAMVAFLEAKKLVRPEAPPFQAELRVIRERLKLMRENISKSHFDQWLEDRNELAPEKKLVLLCGHPRSGTTLLEQVLDSHPDVISAEETEVFHDYSYVPLTRSHPVATPMLPVLEGATTDQLQQARSSYFAAMESLLAQPISGRLLVDKNPSLTFLAPAFLRVFPESKLLIALRDPRDVCLSCFMQPFYPIGATSSAYLTLEETVDEYIALLSNWLAIRPLIPGKFIEVRYEQMVEDLSTTAQQVTTFLGISWDPAVLRFNEHAQKKVVRSPTYSDVTKPVFKSAVGRWQRYEKHLEPYLPRLSPLLTEFGFCI